MKRDKKQERDFPLSLRPGEFIGVVVSRFHSDLTEKLLEGVREVLEPRVGKEALRIVFVPGSCEIPLLAQELLSSPSCVGVIALGVVIQGETDHYRYVCEQVSYGCQKVALEKKRPVIFGVLTTQTEEQALKRVSGEQHKGREAAQALIEVLWAKRHCHV